MISSTVPIKISSVQAETSFHKSGKVRERNATSDGKFLIFIENFLEDEIEYFLMLNGR